MSNPEQLMSTGLALFQQQDFVAAHRHFDDALAAWPDMPDFHNLAGLCRMETGDFIGAGQAFRDAISLSPDFMSYRVNLADCLLVQGRAADARDILREKPALMQQSGPAWTNLGQAWEALGQNSEALSCYRRALELQPGELVCYLNLARGLENTGLAAEAIELLAQVHQLLPFQLECGIMMIALFVGMDRYDDAVQIAAAWRQHHPACAELDMNEAAAWQNQGVYDKARDLYRQAMQAPALLDTTAIDAEIALAMLELLHGNWQQGWQHWQARFLRPDPVLVSTGLSGWDGGPLDGGRLLVRADQGFGDSLQFLRYLPLARERAGTDIVFECPTALHAVLKEIDPALPLIARNQVPPADCLADVAQLNLPYILAHPNPVQAEPVPGFPAKQPDGKLDIGFVCKGSDGHLNDHRRSIPPVLFTRLSGPNRHFWCLQPDAGVDIPGGARQLVQPGDDFLQTARYFEELDLVITVDTAVAHLAGLVGMPCWLLLPFDPDWRWGLGQADSIWYPSLPLFRQPGPGEWEAVLQNVNTALAELERAT